MSLKLILIIMSYTDEESINIFLKDKLLIFSIRMVSS